VCEELFSSVSQTTYFPGGHDKENMSIEFHKKGLKGDHKKMSKEEIEKDLKETQQRLNRLM